MNIKPINKNKNDCPKYQKSQGQDYGTFFIFD